MNNHIVAREPFVSQAANEFVEGNPDFASALNGRIEKAIQLATSGAVFDLGVVEYTPMFLVRSHSRNYFYNVQGRGETWQICSCPDNQRGNRCKHGLAVVFALRATELQQQFDSEWEAAFGTERTGEEMAA